MFLTLLNVNTDNRPGRQWLKNPYRVHQRLWMAFPDAARRAEDEFFLGAWSGPSLSEPKPTRADAGFLFRIERDGPARILVQSKQQPDWDYAFQNAPHLLTTKHIRQFEPAPQREQIYRFRLLAHVVESRSVALQDRGMRRTRRGFEIHRRKRTEVVIHPCPVPEPIPLDVARRAKVLAERWQPWRQWIARVGRDRGFMILDEPRYPLSMQAIHVIVHNPDRNKAMRYNGGLFDGFLRCTNSEELSKAIINGVGHAKAFGFGLLSVAPL